MIQLDILTPAFTPIKYRNTKSFFQVFSISIFLILIPLLLIIMSNKEFISEELSLNLQLKQMITNYLESNPKLTLNTIAVRSKVPATTLRRLMQENNKSEIAPHSVLSLTSFLLKENQIAKLLQRVQGPVKEYLAKCFDQFIFDSNTAQHTLDINLNQLLIDETSYLVFKLAANHNGVSEEYVKENFGLTGLKKLEILIEHGHVYFEDQRFHAKNKNFSLDLKLGLKQAHTLIDQFKINNIESGLNLFYSLSESLNEESIKAIKNIEKNAVKEIFNIMSDRTNLGEIPYFSFIISDVVGELKQTKELLQ